MEAFPRFLPGLKNVSSTVRSRTARALRAYVESEARDLTPQAYAKCVHDLSARILDMLHGHDSLDRIGGIVAMDELVDLFIAESNDQKIMQFAHSLAKVLERVPNTDTATIRAATKALGHLVSTGGTNLIEFVEVYHMRPALTWVEKESFQVRRHAAVMVLKELAINAPTIFYRHVDAYFEVIWNVVRDNRSLIRESTAESLQACFSLIQARESNRKHAWYSRTLAEIEKGLIRGTPEAMHGSLLVLNELLRNSGDFMYPHFDKVCKQVLQYKDHKSSIVKRAVIMILPRLAKFNLSLFVDSYLQECIHYLLSILLSSSSLKTDAFLSVGKITLASGSLITRIDCFILDIISAIQDGLGETRKKDNDTQREALSCLRMVAEAIGPSLSKINIEDLIDVMFKSGLNRTMIETLITLVKRVPSQRSVIQVKLFDRLSKILSNGDTDIDTPSNGSSPNNTSTKSNALSTKGNQSIFSFFSSIKEKGYIQGAYVSDPSIKSLQILALDTLSSFDFQGNRHIPLTQFVHSIVVKFLDSEIAGIRKAAAITCGKLVLPPGEEAPIKGEMAEPISAVLERLLTVGIGDMEADIRAEVLASLDSRFDPLLGQSDNLRCLFIALNDEIFEIRETAMRILGRLTLRNPSFVMPTLRVTLVQLLQELEYSGDSRGKEEGARLLGYFIRSASHLSRPYVLPILKALVKRIQDPNSSVSTAVIAALGDLAFIGSVDLFPYLDQILPSVIEAIREHSSPQKLKVAIRTLGQLISSTGYVIRPYYESPDLLDLLCSVLTRSGDVNTRLRIEAGRVIGIIGALDPYSLKQINQSRQGRSGHTILKESTWIKSKKTHKNRSMHMGVVSGEKIEVKVDKPAAAVILPSQEMLPSLLEDTQQYFPAVAINALVRILSESRNVSHYQGTILAIMYICRSLGRKSSTHLDKIIPVFLCLFERINHDLREFLFEQIASLVRITGSSIKNYLDHVIVSKIIFEFWENHLNAIMCLMEEIARSLGDDFKVYLPDLVPRMLRVIRREREIPVRPETQLVLRTIVSFGKLLDGYLHLVIPVLVKLIQSGAEVLPRRQALLALRSLIRELNVSDFASKIIHMLGRVLTSNNEELNNLSMDCLCCMIYTLQEDYAIFVPVVNQLLKKRANHGHIYDNYNLLVSKILKYQPLPTPSWAYTSSNESAKYSLDGTDEETKRLPVNQSNLTKAWESSQRSTQDDWYEWMRAFSVELLRESPSPSLRACKDLASVYSPLAQELFNAAFVSVWPHLTGATQDHLIRALETALHSSNIPSEILQTLLNLAEFMEHDDQPLPIDIRILGELAEKCHSYAKALHYKELEFNTSPSAEDIDSLITINNKLNQFEAAIGILQYAQGHLLELDVKASWHEKLRKWDDALDAHEKVLQENENNIEAIFGKMRCLYAVGQWKKLNDHVHTIWSQVYGGPQNHDILLHPPRALKQELCSYGARVSLVLQRWDSIPKFINPDMDEIEANLFRAVSSIRNQEFEDATHSIMVCRKALDPSLRSLVSESYSRAYIPGIVNLQTLTELEEVLEYSCYSNKAACKSTPNRSLDHLKKIWTDRMLGVERNIQVWQSLLAIRSLVLEPCNDIDAWLKYSSLCRKSGQMNLALSALWRIGAQSFIRSIERNPFEPVSICFRGPDAFQPHPRVAFSYCKHLWVSGKEDVALQQLIFLVDALEHSDFENEELIKLRVKAYIKLAEWQITLLEPKLQTESLFDEVLKCLDTATKLDSDSYKAWHEWALMNFRATEASSLDGSEKVERYVAPAINGFFQSILLGCDTHDVTKDVLRLLTLWFSHGHRSDVHHAMLTGFHQVSIDTWLDVIPQLIARIHSVDTKMNSLLHDLLSRIGQQHPQALIYPITVASTSSTPKRKLAAEKILEEVRRHSSQLVNEAELVSRELIRVAILWHELWYEALEEASRFYFNMHNAEAMINELAPLNALLDSIGTLEPPTLRELAFHQAYAMDLHTAKEWTDRYEISKCTEDLNQAWDIYYNVFARIRKQLNNLNSLELANAAPRLLSVSNLSLAVPGTYKSGAPVVRIDSFNPKLTVLSSKQRPRKVTIHASDGCDYPFLLKGHEDLRQDERVMQLFGLINTLLANDGDTSRRNLAIERYSVLPLSHSSGLIGWVPNCDTLHQLIRDYREARKIQLNVEHRLMVQMSPDYDKLPLINKVEVFRHALAETTGQDLYRVLWLKSSNSEVWLDRRRNYTRSLAVMSMAGYILGLGDRHPSNLMLDRLTGKIVHIDFGDCFEVAMERDKYPEKVPFRLTRMLTQAMEVSGIEGNFRYICECVMRVLRDNRDSLLAVLEAFVYDPLITWRLLAPNAVPSHARSHDGDHDTESHGEITGDENEKNVKAARHRNSSVDAMLELMTKSELLIRDREQLILENDEYEIEETVSNTAMPELNEKALKVIDRVKKKLHGRDFEDGTKPLNVENQVDRLIQEATSHENLCQLYYGWCGFW